MVVTSALPFAEEFVSEMDRILREIDPRTGLSDKQKEWFAFCITATFVTNTICWKQFERASLGEYPDSSLSWMFCEAQICWDKLLPAAVSLIIQKYGIRNGTLVLDDTGKKRSKNTSKIYKTFKMPDKGTGGYVNGQSLVVLILVTPKITIPVGFEFYMPDPEVTAWNKINKKLKKQGVPPKDRPKKPPKNDNYPTKQELALKLLHNFRQSHPKVRIKCVLADTLYGTSEFLREASEIFNGVQVISQLRQNQNILSNNQKISLEQYFLKQKAFLRQVKIRGVPTYVTMSCARLRVCAHGKKRLIIALKYEGEEEYRYLVATDLSWRTKDVVQAYSIRWLVEVFFQDWKSYEGWDQLAKQPGKEGSKRSLILSLLLDLSLFFHPEQLAQLENQLPACTVGSLQEIVKLECLFKFVQDLIDASDPRQQLHYLMMQASHLFKPNLSKKHMIGRSIGRLDFTGALKYHYRNHI